MFDIGATELLVVAVVAILVIGPKDMPLALRTAGRWIGKIRRVSAHFRSGIDAMIREAEMEEMDKKWRERNAQIMAEHPAEEMTALSDHTESSDPAKQAANAESALARDAKRSDGADGARRGVGEQPEDRDRTVEAKSVPPSGRPSAD